MTEVANYLYCLLRSPRRPALAGVPRGLPGCGAPRVLDAGGRLWLVAADAPLSEYGSEALEHHLKDVGWVSRCALAHEAVIEFFARAPASLPLKLFTLFASDARALSSIEGRRKKVERLLDRVDGHREWSVRLSVDPRRVAQVVVDQLGKSRSSSGAAFLARKRELRYAGHELAESAKSDADAVFKDLARFASDRRRRSENEAAPGTRLLLDAVYLVPTGARSRFTTSARKAQSALSRRGLRLELTGPWPPYHFAA
jgi:hypothetical protein